MTRNKYCDVCGTELGRSRKRKRKDFSVKQKPKSKVFRKKITISILVALVLVSIIVPAVYVPLGRRAHPPGEITLITISIDNSRPEYVQLHLTLKVVSGDDAEIDKIHLYSYDRQKRYQSMIVKRDFYTGRFILRTFVMNEGQLEDLNYGFSLLIDYRFGKQWIKYHFG